MRTIDPTKRSNKKCDHCSHWIHGDDVIPCCGLSNEAKDYYNRCKNFAWREDIVFAEKKDYEVAFKATIKVSATSEEEARKILKRKLKNLELKHKSCGYRIDAKFSVN